MLLKVRIWETGCWLGSEVLLVRQYVRVLLRPILKEQAALASHLAHEYLWSRGPPTRFSYW